MVSRRSMSLFHRTYRPADSGCDGRQVMTALTAATFPSPSNWKKVSGRLGCRLVFLIRGLHPGRQRPEGAGVLQHTVHAQGKIKVTQCHFDFRAKVAPQTPDEDCSTAVREAVSSGFDLHGRSTPRD